MSHCSKIVHRIGRLKDIVEKMKEIEGAPFCQNWDEISFLLHKKCEYFQVQKRKGFGNTSLGKDKYPFCSFPTYIYMYLNLGQFVSNCSRCPLYQKEMKK